MFSLFELWWWRWVEWFFLTIYYVLERSLNKILFYWLEINISQWTSNKTVLWLFAIAMECSRISQSSFLYFYVLSISKLWCPNTWTMNSISYILYKYTLSQLKLFDYTIFWFDSLEILEAVSHNKDFLKFQQNCLFFW